MLNVTKCLSEHPSSEIAIRTYVGQGALKIRISRFFNRMQSRPNLHSNSFGCLTTAGKFPGLSHFPWVCSKLFHINFPLPLISDTILRKEDVSQFWQKAFCGCQLPATGRFFESHSTSSTIEKFGAHVVPPGWAFPHSCQSYGGWHNTRQHVNNHKSKVHKMVHEV